MLKSFDDFEFSYSWITRSIRLSCCRGSFDTCSKIISKAMRSSALPFAFVCNTLLKARPIQVLKARPSCVVGQLLFRTPVRPCPFCSMCLRSCTQSRQSRKSTLLGSLVAQLHAVVAAAQAPATPWATKARKGSMEKNQTN